MIERTWKRAAVLVKASPIAERLVLKFCLYLEQVVHVSRFGRLVYAACMHAQLIGDLANALWDMVIKAAMCSILFKLNSGSFKAFCAR